MSLSINSINKSADYPYLQISLNNIPKSNETRDFKADIGVIFTLADSHKEEVEAINDSELVDNLLYKYIKINCKV